MNATLRGIFCGYYGNYSFAIDAEIDGQKFVLSCDQSSLIPHIKKDRQEEELKRIADIVVEKLNASKTVKGSAA